MRSACYPRGNFYPLSAGRFVLKPAGSLTPAFAPARLVGLTVKLAYRVCTTSPGFHSGLANLCTPPLHFWRQPPQLNCPPDSVLLPDFYGGVSKISSFRRVVFHILPEGSHLFSTVKITSSVSSYSKASWGLFVHVQVGRIFTAISISPGNSSRQSLSHSTFRAGRNLPDTIMLLPPANWRTGCPVFHFGLFISL